jgi:PAS domain S-box-containing protein
VGPTGETVSSHTASQDEDPASVITCDMTGIVSQYTGGAQAIFQYSPAEVIGKMSVAQFHPPENVPTLVPRLLKTAVDTGKFQEEVTLVRKDGRKFRAVLTVRPMMREGQQVGFMGYTRPLEKL